MFRHVWVCLGMSGYAWVCLGVFRQNSRSVPCFARRGEAEPSLTPDFRRYASARRAVRAFCTWQASGPGGSVARGQVPLLSSLAEAKPSPGYRGGAKRNRGCVCVCVCVESEEQRKAPGLSAKGDPCGLGQPVAALALSAQDLLTAVLERRDLALVSLAT
jgi:hypothetical protein